MIMCESGGCPIMLLIILTTDWLTAGGRAGKPSCNLSWNKRGWETKLNYMKLSLLEH